MKNKKTMAAVSAAVISAALGLSNLPVLADDNASSSQPGSMQNGTPMEKPEGDSGTPPGMPADGGIGGPGGADTQNYDYNGDHSGAKTADGEEVTSSDETIDTEEADENAALSENGGTLTIQNGTLNKSGDDTDGDNCNFYGLNSISLTVGENSKTVVSDSSLNADSDGSNGIFATDSGSAYANNSSITTSADNSRGLDATYGGSVIAGKMTITTQGDHSAALATDRGGGNISLNDGTLNTAGSGSPLLYSTGDIEVDNVTGTASGSQIAGMEGLNRILILNSSLTSTQTDKTASDPIADGVIIYQSASGDAETSAGEKALFQAVNSTLSSRIASGAMFYVTNTDADIVLSNTALDFDSSKAELLHITGNDANNWGTAGSNGADVKFTGYGEKLSGDITVDTISSLDACFLNGTTYNGTITIETNAVNTDVSETPVTVNISSDSTWTVTGDSEVTDLNVEAGGKVVDSDGKTVTITANGKTVVQGDSPYTVTVDGNYGTSFETDSENEVTADYIDRTAFDDTFSTSTAFKETASAEPAASSETVQMKKDETNDSHTVIWIAAGAVIAIVAIGGIVMKNRKLKK